ncbi:hypothetical protein JKY72_00850 [Candidatus Gracilibacteria bacterium]|nr:hypothetical protein [Candidatus Gracilibacteria bacterium]
MSETLSTEVQEGYFEELDTHAATVRAEMEKIMARIHELFQNPENIVAIRPCFVAIEPTPDPEWLRVLLKKPSKLTATIHHGGSVITDEERANHNATDALDFSIGHLRTWFKSLEEQD